MAISTEVTNANRAATPAPNGDALATCVMQRAAPWTTPGAPGGAVAVLRDGEVCLREAFGLADLATGAPFTPQTVFHICSLTKQFTTTALLLLEEEGRVDLGASVRAVLTELPDVFAPITLRHLATNTSGLRDYMVLPGIATGMPFGDFTRESTTQLIHAQRTLMFPPGTRAVYSNTNFVLLGWLMERIENRPLADIFERRIFAPLGMRETRFLTQTQPQPEGSAVGYYADERGGYRSPRLNVYEAGDGGVWSTLDDLILWERNFFANRLGRGDVFERLTEAPTLRDGTRSWYAYGLGTGRFRGAFWQGHSGGLSGMGLNRLHFPEQKFSAIVIANGPQGLDPQDFTFEIAACLLPDTQPSMPLEPMRRDVWRAHAGVYCHGEGAQIVRLRLDAEALLLDTSASTTRLTAQRDDIACDSREAVQVRVLDAQRVAVRFAPGPWLEFQRVGAMSEPTPQACCGRFHSRELDARYVIERDGDGYRLQILGPQGSAPTFSLERWANDVFVVLAPSGARTGVTLTFLGDRSTLLVSAPKAERILFEREI